MEFEKISNLLSDKEMELSKYIKKRWVKIYDDNNRNYDRTIRYVCTTLQDKLVDYADGYILLEGYIRREANEDLEAGTMATVQNGTSSLVKKCIIKLNNVDMENNHNPNLTTPIQNFYEYSGNYIPLENQYAFVVPGVEAEALERDRDIKYVNLESEQLADAVAGDGGLPIRRPIKAKIPLKYLSNFIRRLDFPIINNLFEIEIELNPINGLVRTGANALQLVTERTILYLPIIDLPRSN